MEFQAGKYHIRFSQQKHGKSYYLAFTKYGELGEHTFRDAKSQYVFMEPAFEPSQAKIWHLVPMGNNEYQICFEENGIRYHLCAQQYYPADKRDQLSVYVSAHQESHQGNIRWHLHREGGSVRIVMAQYEYNLNGYELNFHEFYKHSDVMRKTQGQRFDQTLHHSENFWNCIAHQEKQHHHWVLEPAGFEFIAPQMQMAQQAMQFVGQTMEKTMEQMMGMMMPGMNIPTGKYYLSVQVPYKQQPYHLSLSAQGELGDMTNRDANSQFVFGDNQMHKASVWEVTHHPQHNYYIIKTECNGRTYHLCVHDFYPTDKRDGNSKYASAHTMESTQNVHWHIKPRGNEYLLTVAGSSFNLRGWHLCCQAFYQYDKIYSSEMQRCDFVLDNKDHALNCFVHSDPNQGGIGWKFTPAGNHPHHQQPQYQPQPQQHHPHQGIVNPGKHFIKLHGKHQFMSLMTEGEFGQFTYRDQNSFYVILQPHKSQAWEIEKSHDHTYKIFCKHNGKHYYLCCHSFYPNDDRDINSKYLQAHTDPNQQNTRWHIRHKHGGYEICQAENNFNLEEWSIGAHTFYQFEQISSGAMKRCDFVLQNSQDYINCIVHKIKSEPNLVWELEPTQHEKVKEFNQPQQQPMFPPGMQPPFPGMQPQFPGMQPQFPQYPGMQPQFPGMQPMQPQFPGMQPPQPQQEYPGQQQQYPNYPTYPTYPNYPNYPGQQF